MRDCLCQRVSMLESDAAFCGGIDLHLKDAIVREAGTLVAWQAVISPSVLQGLAASAVLWLLLSCTVFKSLGVQWAGDEARQKHCTTACILKFCCIESQRQPCAGASIVPL